MNLETCSVTECGSIMFIRFNGTKGTQKGTVRGHSMMQSLRCEMSSVVKNIKENIFNITQRSKHNLLPQNILKIFTVRSSYPSTCVRSTL